MEYTCALSAENTDHLYIIKKSPLHELCSGVHCCTPVGASLLSIASEYNIYSN